MGAVVLSALSAFWLESALIELSVISSVWQPGKLDAVCCCEALILSVSHSLAVVHWVLIFLFSYCSHIVLSVLVYSLRLASSLFLRRLLLFFISWELPSLVRIPMHSLFYSRCPGSLVQVQPSLRSFFYRWSFLG